MGKNYVENSLKRFLKRKVKITLGVVVTFLITGIVSFGAEGTVTVEEYQKDYIEAIESLKELGIKKLEFNNKDVDDIVISNLKDKNGNNTITIKNSSFEKEIEIQDKYLTKNTENIFKDIITNLKNKTTTSEKQKNEKDSLVLLNEKTHGKILHNEGVIISRSGYSPQITSSGATGVTLQNDGILIADSIGQFLYNTTSSKSVNDGIIIATSSGQIAGSIDSELINNGLIISKSTGQAGNGKEDVNLLNKGVIVVDSTASASAGQLSNNISAGKTEIKNYGLIESNIYGQRLVTLITDKPETELFGKAENFGIISSKVGQEAYGKNMSVYNYGLITTTSGTAISGLVNGKGYNYGVVEVADASKAFSGDVTNKGIVIADSGELKQEYNTGIFIDSNYELRENNTDTQKFNAGNTIKDFAENSSFEKDKTKAYVKNESVNIDNTQGKIIGAVVTKDSTLNEAVLKYEGKDLFLKDTTITGYFEKEGTLLDVGTGNLTLGGDTNITVAKNSFNFDVTAVKLGDSGKVTIIGDAKINGKIEGGTGTIHFADSKGVYNVESGNVEIGISDEPVESNYQKYFNVTLTSTTPDKDNQTSGENINYIKLSTENAVVDLKNTLVIDSSVKVGKNDKGYSIYDTNTTNENAELELTVNSIHDLVGNVLLGAGKDTFIVKSQDPHGIDDENHKDKFIDLGEGEDKFIAEGTAGKNIFGYNVVNAETIELKNGAWGDWNKAGKISFTDSTKAGNQPNLVLGNDTTMNITLNATGEHGSDFADYVGTKLGLNHTVITGIGKESVAKYQIDETNGLDTEKLSTTKYSFGEGVSYKDSPIFNISSEEGTGVNISLKTATDLGLSGQQRVIYDAYIKQIIADGSVNKGVINKINNMNNQNDMVNLIKKTDVNGRAYYTAGSVVTKDIVNSYVSSVEEFKPRAEKGQWLAQGKYINSDTEFDGGSKVKGYDGDITGTVGMIEYGITDNTSYGAVFGQGDAEMDINGGGKLDGDNIYAGLYMKHRTANGIELVGNIGYVKSDMDSDLRNDFTTKGEGLSIEGSTTEKGTADSSAVILSLKGRKDYKITDTVKVQPIFGARATFINQEKAENPEMNFTVAEQDIIVLEGTAGMGIAKEFALPQGILELNAGAEYTFAATSSNNDAEYTLFEGDYQATHIKMDDVDAAENTGTVFVGADYEHENGVGFNAKYEMMWSDKGDDSRVTAGISYRF